MKFNFNSDCFGAIQITLHLISFFSQRWKELTTSISLRTTSTMNWLLSNKSTVTYLESILGNFQKSNVIVVGYVSY